MFLQVVLRALARDHFEVLVKAGEIIKTALITELFDADPVVDKQFAGMPYPDLRQELGIGLARPGFEIPAERIRDQPRNGGYLFQVDLFREIPESMIINGIDAVILGFGKIMPEANG